VDVNNSMFGCDSCMDAGAITTKTRQAHSDSSGV
jgi:hypothetical protein